MGSEAFAARVVSQSTDYRYPKEGEAAAALEAAVVPEEILDRCRTLAMTLGLTLAGIDLRRTPDGRWYCFEANPCPAFTFYEGVGSRGQIAGSIARRLLGA